MRKKCSDLKSGFWKGFPTEINITRQPYNRKKSLTNFLYTKALATSLDGSKKIEGLELARQTPP